MELQIRHVEIRRLCFDCATWFREACAPARHDEWQLDMVAVMCGDVIEHVRSMRSVMYSAGTAYSQKLRDCEEITC